MKIVVTTSGPDKASPLDERFGRAPWLIVFDTENKGVEIMDNAVNRDSAQGAGIQTARKVAATGAKTVITGRIGPKAEKTLRAAGVRIFLAGRCHADQAVDLFQSGALSEGLPGGLKS